MTRRKDGAMSNDMSGVSRASWIAIPQAMQQHGQAKRATPSNETGGSQNVVVNIATPPVGQAEPKLL
jgi:hypothetical protein